MNGYRRGGSGILFAILFLVFGAYFINYPFNFVKIPTTIDPFNKWVILVGGALLVIAAINQLRLGRYRRLGYY